MKREISPRLNTIRTTIQFLYELSKCVGITKKFNEMTNEDVLLYLDSCRKSESDDPLHKWIGTYNSRRASIRCELTACAALLLKSPNLTANE